MMTEVEVITCEYVISAKYVVWWLRKEGTYDKEEKHTMNDGK